MAKNPVVWWEINAQDGSALTEFYRAVFEWDCRLDERSGLIGPVREEPAGDS